MQHIINNVSVLYPRLNQPYRFDSGENKSVPCQWDDEGACYETSFVMEKDEAVTLGRICKEAYKNAASIRERVSGLPNRNVYLPRLSRQMTERLSITASAVSRPSTALIKLSNPKQVDAKKSFSQVISG